MQTERKIIAEKTFRKKVWSETAYSRRPIGLCDNKMTLIGVKGQYLIQWEVENEDYEDEVDIGIWTVHNKVVEYNGVFEIPVEALELLRENGFDTTEIE